MRSRVLSMFLITCVITFGWSHVMAAKPVDQAKPKDDSAALVKNPDSIKGKIELKVEAGLAQYGPWALFGVIMLAGVGIPVSEELLIIPAGFLIERGVLPLWGTLLAAWLGVVLADTIWMLIVRRYAHRLLSIRFFRRMFHPRRLLEIKYLMDQHAVWVIIMGRVLPAARTPTITAAGLAHMPLGPFLVGECIGAMKSVGWQLFLGWLIAKGLGDSIHDRHVRDAILIGLGVLVVLLVIWSIRRHRRAAYKRKPRAPMRWLTEVSKPPSQRSKAVS